MKSGHPAVPPGVSRPWIVTALSVWCLAHLVTVLSSPVPIAPGSFQGEVRMSTAPFDGRYGSWALGSIDAGSVLVQFDSPVSAGRGDVLVVSGTLEGKPGRAAGRDYQGVLDVAGVDSLQASDFFPHVAGRAVRDTVVRQLQPFDDGRGLLAGFLIGDTSRVDESDIDAMRRSGLAHFVAVSGSNVALFLGLLAIAAGPLALGPRRRALIGLAGLPIYAAATRFEPSVMRASVMAGMALGGRLLGLVLEAWQLLSVAVIALLLLDPGLTSNVGFQLSVAATAGVLVGARWPVRGRIAKALAITIGAQVAVAPLLMVHFGSVPLLSPVVNLVAAPLVAAATTMGAIGTAGVGFLIGPAAAVADVVLWLARGAATWPQLRPWQLVGLLALGSVIWWRPGLRASSAAIGSVALAMFLVTPGEALPPGSVVVLDVGQGDAILISGGDGRLALIDGGPDRLLLMDKLRSYDVRSLELMVLTHVHADHATGLTGLVGNVAIGEVWADIEPHSTEASASLMNILDDHGIVMNVPAPGERLRLGEVELVVEGPVRRYASPNDQSIVITVQGEARSMLLAGDIETYAQHDLDHLTADVLKVPHQGGATSDADWLASVGADLAVISVGPNQYGHPADWVIEVLEEAGTTVVSTDESGDVVIDLS